MMNLFSSFDIKFYFGPSLFLLLSLSIFFHMFFHSSFKSSFIILSNFMITFFLSLKPANFNKMSNLLFLSFFFSLLIFNLFSVFPFNFPLGSQISGILIISGGFWSSLIIFSLSSNFKGLFLHLVPEGAPLILIVFLFLIELISNLIRPLTLMVRLVANILAGHLLMILLSLLVKFFLPTFIIYVGLNVVEIFVSLIQSYIFSTMIVLYFSEI